ncbi:uncharacterized protein Z518_02816 [Rhinocladiella mackenziei CBS 650.93]|uniref:BZIP domain-containing protein n=1 Tax=Rhinocladiella mackenziei CBS 650.93 TaxID=1442369 RepID=A0A0D2JFS6_9EURO|nr:uncharacterized protein Z518_02816 [Rhinocladiella mackenziei CBS 650.93]KIX08160.1 hypothetical protein Z518_02816 [Rhinocladiella mackenziei CBS 650.93]
MAFPDLKIVNCIVAEPTQLQPGLSALRRPGDPAPRLCSSLACAGDIDRVSPVQSSQSPSLGPFHSSTNHRSFSSPALHSQPLPKQNLRQLAHLHRLPPVPPFGSNTSVPRRNRSVPSIPQGDMATAFDSMFLPGGDMLTSHDDFMDIDTNFQSNNFTAVTSGTTANDGTISPSDLFNDDAIMSAPPSTAFPNLSTPESGYLESPAMASSGLNTSPLEDGLLDGQLNFAELDSMAPLFPQNGFDQFANQPTSSESISMKSNFSAVNSRPSSNTSPMVRQKSSPGRPPSTPFSHGRKHSENYGITKAKPRKALPDIIIDSDDDKETAKRKKNTAAARKSRQRKQEHAEAAEAEIQRLRGIIYRLGADPDAES